MIPEGEFPQLIEYRQREIRATAYATRQKVPTVSLRQRAGRSLIRLGLWVDGRCPELVIEPVPTTGRA